MFTSARPEVLAVLEAGYGPLFDRVVAVLGDDERVRALWLSGSLARGTADAASDLDVLVAVADEHHEAFAAEWRDWLAEITPTVIARPLPFAPGSFFAVTPGRERLDVVVEPVAWLAHTLFRDRLLVFDRDGLDAAVPPPEPGPPPSPEKIAGLVEEFFREYGMLNVVTDRRDWLLGLEAIHSLRGLLYQLFVESNAPLPMMGVKQWSTKLTADQRRVLETLQAAAATLDEVVTACEVIGRAFREHAREICARFDVPWPEELEAATMRYLRSHGLSPTEAEPA